MTFVTKVIATAAKMAPKKYGKVVSTSMKTSPACRTFCRSAAATAREVYRAWRTRGAVAAAVAAESGADLLLGCGVVPGIEKVVDESERVFIFLPYRNELRKMMAGRVRCYRE
jgi:hypothetical protein